MTSNPNPSPDDNYFVDKADDAIARPLGNSFVGLVTQFIQWIYNKLINKKQTLSARETYKRKYYGLYGKIRLFGMSQEVNLEEIYTSVKFLDELTTQAKFGSLDALRKNYSEQGQRRFQTGECQPVQGFKVANDHQFLYVLGNPGAGKSTFLRRVGLEALKGDKGKYQHDCIPVMIELKKFNKVRVDLIAAITEELSNFNFPSQQKVITDFLNKGKLLLLFDGLDEVSKDKFNDVQDEITNLVTRYGDRGNRFILSCRIAAYKNPMSRFTNVELADFDDEQIKNFIINWFNSDPEDAQDCWKKLSQSEYKASKELAQTPLLLTFLCLAYGDSGDFPAQRSQLYYQALEILLYKWDREKKLKRDKIYKDWNPNLEITLLSEFAFDFFEDNQLFFKKQNILEYLEVFLSNTEGNSQYIDVNAVLDAIAVQQGIFVERATNIYSFSHLTLQEYLTAKHISQKDSRVEKLVSKYLIDRRWKEIFLLVAGEKNNADQILELMSEATHNLMNTQKLKNILQWVARITNPTDGDVKYIGKIGLAIANASTLESIITHANTVRNPGSNIVVTAITDMIPNVIANIISIAVTDTMPNANSYAQSYAYSNAYSNGKAYANSYAYIDSDSSNHLYAQRTIDYFLRYISWAQKWEIYREVNYSFLINELEILKHKIPAPQASKSRRKDFIERLWKTWFAAFHTTQKMMRLSEEEIEILDNYLYANLLIFECKNAAVRVSQKTWQKIESEILLST
ncbi:MAG: NACHT domain-containing protein [Cyanobacteria bacterium P01_F01_bin.143]